MGRKIDSDRRETILKAIEDNSGGLRAGGVAKLLGLHPQEVTRVLTALEDEPEKHIYEDDDGFLSWLKFW